MQLTAGDTPAIKLPMAPSQTANGRRSMCPSPTRRSSNRILIEGHEPEWKSVERVEIEVLQAN